MVIYNHVDCALYKSNPASRLDPSPYACLHGLLMFQTSPKGVFFLYSSLYFVYFSMNQNLVRNSCWPFGKA